MKKILYAILMFALSGLIPAKADEGMWIPLLLNRNYAEMQRLGLKITPEDIYNANQKSLKDAIVWFNGGCTGEIISSKGLVLTNHHCGYGQIAKHSTPNDNILDNGFFAADYGKEKANPGLWVSIVVRIEEVSDAVNQGIRDLNDPNLIALKKKEIYNTLTKKATEGTHYEAQIRDFYSGNQYFLFVFEKFNDIRLVGAPPQNIGKFGGDADNWMWPRHTGDFSLFRIYANKDNKPANYSTENTPYTPKHSLPVNIGGIKDGDFSMVFGFPGRTNRYETSFGIKMAIEETNPTIVDLRDFRLKAWKAEMNKSDSVRLLMSSQYAQIANYWKYFIGQTEQLVRLKVFDQKTETEKAFNKWAADKASYNGVIDNLRIAHEQYTPYAKHRMVLNEGIFASSVLQLSFGFIKLEKLLNDKAPQEEIEKAAAEIKTGSQEWNKTFLPIADEKILANALHQFYLLIPTDQHPAYMAEILKKNKAKTPGESFEKFAAKVFKTSMAADLNKLNKFLAKPSLKVLQKDLAFQTISSFYSNYTDKIKPVSDKFTENRNTQSQAYIKGLMLMNEGKLMYPDANSTLRLTYGKVRSYNPKDGVHYKHYTTLNGVVEKYNPNDFEFDVPARLIELAKAKDFGQYADKDGQLPVAFITDNDITGGNSGSPVLNGNGELIGLAFDGNWEAMSGDIYYDEQYKRCINVDIRYVLFLIDKFGKAPHIISEMKLIGNK